MKATAKLLCAPISTGATLIAVDPSNEDAVIGLRVAVVHDRDTCDKTSHGDYKDLMSAGFSEYYASFTPAYEAAFQPWRDVFEKRPEFRRLFHMYGVCVRKDYRKRGIATALVKAATDFAKQLKCQGVVAVSTCDIATKIFREKIDNADFKVLNR